MGNDASNRMSGAGPTQGQPAPPPGPVLAVCGFSGSGKTTLIERTVPRLVKLGLTVAVVKHDVHGIDVDRPGKDSDRLFRAGADVVLRAPDQSLHRVHGSRPAGLGETLAALLADHDLILVEGHKDTPLPKLWLSGRQGDPPPPGVDAVITVLPWDSDRERAMLDRVDAVLDSAHVSTPIFGGILIGGSSTRMGTPKHLLSIDGSSLLARTHRALARVTEPVILLGHGPTPPPWHELARVPDPPGVRGPIAGMLAALRWAPAAAWLIVGCDMPRLSTEAVQWLCAQRRPGRWAILPRLAPDRIEPLLAVYEPRSRAVLEDLVRAGNVAPRSILSHPQVVSPEVPPELRQAWTNVNCPEDLHRL